MWLSIRNYLAHARGVPVGWRPLLAVYYLTYECRFRCPYCSDGQGLPYRALKSPVLGAERVLELLTRVRRWCDYLVLTGGEPLCHPELEEVLSRLDRLRFDGVVLTTNGDGLGPHLDAVARSVRYLVFSVDTLDREKADRWYGVGPGTQARILETIEAAARHPRRNYEILISAVATPDNLVDLHAVYRWARERGFRFALCPQLVGVKAHAALAGNQAYTSLYDLLIAEKKAGWPVNGNVAYLEHMRDLLKFRCHPSMVLAIDPCGHAFYPCLELGNQAGNLLTSELDDVRGEAMRRFGPEPSCDPRCHSACALGLSLVADRPSLLLQEAALAARALVRRWTGH